MGTAADNELLQALDRAGDGALATDDNGRIVFWNRVAQRLLGWASTDVVGRACCEVLDGRCGDDDAGGAETCPVLVAARRGLAVESFDVKSRTKAGRSIQLNVSTLALAPGNGVLMVHLFRDVTVPRVAPPGDPSRADQSAGAAAAGALTRRELEVLRLLATGANTRAAAERLGVSPATVRNHVQNMLGKLGVHSRLQAVAYATNHGLL